MDEGKRNGQKNQLKDIILFSKEDLESFVGLELLKI